MGKPYKLMTEEEKSSFNQYCIQRWRQRKLDAVKYKGGKCERCGYDKYPDVLEFHHLDPSQKESSWNSMRKWNWEKVLTELDKCAILCANCHREVHVEQRLGS
jgi:predicted HNH restriction endonuclease